MWRSPNYTAQTLPSGQSNDLFSTRKTWSSSWIFLLRASPLFCLLIVFYHVCWIPFQYCNYFVISFLAASSKRKFVGPPPPWAASFGSTLTFFNGETKIKSSKTVIPSIVFILQQFPPRLSLYRRLKTFYKPEDSRITVSPIARRPIDAYYTYPRKGSEYPFHLLY